ncbi:MAG: hypothetical protein KJ626_00735 [Verrucomicrobia bacterium]|nr:hypothetical protein [Verrucomicrobiota bacterium]
MNIEEQVITWRKGVMEKPRRGITRSEYIAQFLDLIRPRIHPVVIDLDKWQIRHARYEGPGRNVWVDRSWRTIKKGDEWGGEGLTGFFRTSFAVPPSCAGQPLMLDAFVGGDGVVHVNGKPFAGLECFHREILLDRKARAGKKYDFMLEVSVDHQVTPGPRHTLHYARIVTIDKEVESFYWDIYAAFIAADNEWAGNGTAEYVLKSVEDAMLLCDPYEEGEQAFRQGLRKARRHLHELVYDNRQLLPEGQLTILGHSHLDPVYLWDFKEFQRKILRTHTTQLMLMKEYPDWKFSQSQAVLYRELKRLYPDVYAGIKKRIEEGRWEALGGMFVEPDCNLVSGESLVRQFLFGQRFFRREFGATCKVGWLPDVFGLPQTLPQIMQGCGVEYFYTAKLVWNDTNEWKTHLFWWVAPDGTRVLTHTPPLHFIGTCEAPHVMKYWKMLQPKKHVKEGLYTYGWGDGGGGVERRMLFVADRYKRMPGVPELKHRLAEDYFDDMAASVRPDLPEWKNELYLETHRGTYTSAALLKKYNRQSEVELRETEILSSAARTLGATYQQADINAAWEAVLINQFHDILPGSHVPKGFKDAVADYEQALKGVAKVKRTALNRIAGAGTHRTSKKRLAFNSLLWDRKATIELDGDGKMQVCDSLGNRLPTQTIGNGKILVQVGNVPSCGYETLTLSAASGAASEDAKGVMASETKLENEFIRLELDANGEIKSLFDKRTRRQIIQRGQRGNRYQLFEDNPGKYDAWDIARVYEKRRWDITEASSVRLVEKGPLRGAIEVTKTFSRSVLKQTYLLEKGRPWVDCRVWIDWREDYRLLKVAFPLSVRSRKASYHIPYGTIERSTGEENSWEKAKFEVPALMWADLSDRSGGLSLINDCKHGYDVKGNVMRLTLLKASKFPNPQADRHEHTLGFRLYPHADDWRKGGTWQAAQDFNTPLAITVAAKHPPADPARFSFLDWDGKRVVQLEAWKQAEDGDEHIVRVREIFGRTSEGSLKLPFSAARVVETNLLEDEIKSSRQKGRTLKVSLKPHEVKTFRITPSEKDASFSAVK